MSPPADAICVTVDVEDWTQSTLDHDAALSPRCERNALAALDLFDELQLTGTWFVQGMLARDFPEVPRRIAARGHEVACHAHSHRPLFAMDAARLDEEIGGAKARLEDLVGAAVVGFRAPDFSLGPPVDRLEQLDRRVFAALSRHGFAYDSSVVPAKMRRYGWRGPIRRRSACAKGWSRCRWQRCASAGACRPSAAAICVSSRWPCTTWRWLRRGATLASR
jgi:peptidoglycan/xylan/chitin deacetylase (PgdA/CDA1 family)